VSPQRRVRPEDLRPSHDDPNDNPRGPNGLASPSGSPDPPDVAALEEAMVPQLSLSSYLALSTALLAVLPNLRTTRFLSELMGLCLFAIPFVLAGYTTGLLGDANNPLTHVVVDNSQSAPLPSSSVMTAVLIASIVGVLLWILLKSMLDSRGYSLLRHTLSGHDSRQRPGKTKTWAFFSSNLVQFALAMGAGMGTAPVILRISVQGLTTEGSNLFISLVAPITIGMILYAWIRVMCMYISAWMTWRPTFIPGALGAAFASPLRGARIFWASFALLLPLLTASALALTLCASGMWAPAVDVDLPHFFLHLCLIGVSIFLLQSLIWFDVAIVTSIGHRTGEFAVAHTHEDAVRMRSAALKANLTSGEQQTITAAYPGMYRAPHNSAYQPIFFEEIYAEIERLRPESAPAPATEFAQGPDEDRNAPALEEASPSNPWIVEVDFEGGGDARGLKRLEKDLLPLTLRTANGQPERRFVGVRTHS